MGCRLARPRAGSSTEFEKPEVTKLDDPLLAYSSCSIIIGYAPQAV